MSIRIMSWVWDQTPDLEPKQLLVLLALADRADDDGVCWPSQATLAVKCRMSRVTVNGIIRELIEKGYLRKSKKYPSSMKQNNLYQILTSPIVKTSLHSNVKASLHDSSIDSSLTPFHKNEMEAPPPPEQSPMVFEQETIPDQPAPQVKEKKSFRDERTYCAAVQAFRRVVGRYPRRAVYGLVIAKMGGKPDDKLIQLAWETWNARGFNPEGIGWLDWVAAGEVPKNGKKPAPEPVYAEQY